MLAVVKLSREAQIGLAAAVHLAAQPEGALTQAGEVAAELDLSPTFIAKALQKLSRAGVLRSSRGAERGYSLARPATDITVRQVVEAIDVDVFRHCVFWSERCSETRPCMLHPVWKTVRPRVVELLDTVSIDDLRQGRSLTTILPRIELIPAAI